MSELLSVATPEGAFQLAPDIKGGPVEPDHVLKNITDSERFDFPLLTKNMKPREGTMIFVAGGPTLLDHLEEIKERKAKGEYICTSNNTHDFLVDHGIIPDACLILDPKNKVKGYVKKPQQSTQYYLATVCDPEVFEFFKGAGVQVKKVLLAYGLDTEEDIKLQERLYKRPSYDFLVGGTMTPLRAMPFACLAGFKRIEFYGFDSCFSSKDSPVVKEGEPGFGDAVARSGGTYYTDTENGEKYAINEKPDGGFFYAYKKPRVENIEVAMTADGRRFLTSPGFAHQAKQAVKWYDRMEGKLEVEIHGDSLTSHLIKLHVAAKERARLVIGDRRWTEEYARLQQELHAKDNYGKWGDKRHLTEPVGRSVLFLLSNLRRPVTLLDYGSGNGALGEHLQWMYRNLSVTNYDPFHPKWKDIPEPSEVHDISTCIDVMEHVEEQCVGNVIKWIAQRTRYIAMFEIDLVEAGKELADGRNAHITQKSAQWWVAQLKEHFQVGEIVGTEGGILIACQKPESREAMDVERSQWKKAA